MKNSITLPLLISISSLMFASQAMAITSSQMQMRISATCDSYANFARIADSDVIYGACITGAKDSMQRRNSTCEKKIKKFNEQAETLIGMKRAEYIEVAQAYRTGCNIGKRN
ncbi:TPA: hypothetical protein ACJI8J_002001 [Kluyvera georgiana]|uniref:Uncharacterized protein n=1 Tax=Kluyvera georgiana ATCC 51603 TaxID=1354264 RepID=A0A1B7JXD6_9ENTR|nr:MULTISPECIES: hypothetical protein [Kluyvera]MCE9891421.1 hypothetical protein [Kluyvera intermedia]OAT52384.1 hypothetical protein M989_02349 [Kluyvera georgiana ATCC 51603]HCE8954268.1 hypothetical protein [Raoultella ornithinolytica]